MNAVAYLRCSTTLQELSPEAQRAAIEAWAAHEHVTVTTWCVDSGVSGGKDLEDRPGLIAALAAVKEHGASMLVVARRDRLARDAFIAITIERAAAKLGASIVCADGVANGDSDADKMIRGILDNVAAYERSLIRSRIRAALAVKKARGERTGGIPYGYKLNRNGKDLEDAPDEQETVRAIAAGVAAGMSARRIARELAPKGRNGRPMSVTVIQRILSGRR